MNFDLTEEQPEFSEGHFTRELASEYDRKEELPRKLHSKAAELRAQASRIESRRGRRYPTWLSPSQEEAVPSQNASTPSPQRVAKDGR